MMLRDTNGCRERSSNSGAIDLNKCAPEFINHHIDLNAISPPPLPLPLSLSLPLPLPLLSPPPLPLPLFSPPPPSPPPNNNGPNLLELRAMAPTTGYIVPSATFWFPQVQPSFTLVTPDLIPNLQSGLSGHNAIAIFEGGGVPSLNPFCQGGTSAGLKEVAIASKLFPEFPSTQRCGIVDRNVSSSSSSSFHRSFLPEELATGSYSHSHSHSYVSQGSGGGVPLQMDRILEQYHRRQEEEAKPPLVPYFLMHARTEEADGNQTWHANGNIPSSSSSAAISSKPTPNLYKDFLMTEPSNNGAVTKDFLGQRRTGERKRRGGSRGFSLQEEDEEDEKEREKEKEKEKMKEEEGNGQSFFLNRHAKSFPPSWGSKKRPFIVGEADTCTVGEEMASAEDWSSGLFRDDRSAKNEEEAENGWDQENMAIARTKLFQDASPEELENYHREAFELSSFPMLDGEKEPGGGSEPSIRVIESPSWLPPRWITMLKTRKSGSTAGTTDKYYKDPDTGRTFRSRNEVLQFIDTGRFTRNKSKTEWGDECSPSDLPYWLVDIPRDGHLGKAQQSNHDDLLGGNNPSIGKLCVEGSSQIQIAQHVDRGDATQNPHTEYLFLMPNNVNASGNICTEDFFSKAKKSSCDSAFEEQANHHQIKLLQEYNAQPYNIPFNLLPPIGHTNTLLKQPFERLDERLLYFRNVPKPVSYSFANAKESSAICGSYGKPSYGPVYQGKRPLVIPQGIPQGIKKQPKLNPKHEKELLVVLGRKLCLQTLGKAI